MKRRTSREKKRKGHTLEYLAYAAIIVVIIWGVYSFLQTPPNSSSQTVAREGSPAPDFTLPIVNENGLTGGQLSLSQFKGKVVVLEFMVSWCPHCRTMAPVIERLQQQYGSREFVIISVAGTWQGADAASTAEFIRTYKATWVHVLDRSNSVFNTYRVDSTPAYYIIDAQGIIRYRYDGEQIYATLAEAIDRLLPSG